MTDQSILGMTLSPDRFSLAAYENGSIKAVSTRELVQPFDHENLRKAEEPLSSHIEIVNDLYQRMKVDFKKLSLVLSSDLVMIKKVPLALGLDEKIARQVIDWEADQMTVSQMNQYIIDSDKLSFQTSNGNSIYLLVLIRKKIVKIVRQLIARAGLQLAKIDVDVFASVRTLKTNYDINVDDICLLIDVKQNHLELTIIYKKEYFLSQKIRFSDAGINAATAEPQEISKLILKEVKRILFGHRLGQNMDDLDQIFLMGNEIAQHVMKELVESVSVPVQMVNPFKRILIAPEVTQSKDYLRNAEKFVSCVGGVL